MADGTPKLTPETAATILDWLRRGHYRKVACAKVRITERTLQNWVKKGEAGIEPYASFVVDMAEAEADVEDELLTAIRGAMPAVMGEGGHGADVWTSRAWIMERRWPKRWSGRVRVSVSEEVDAFTARLKSNPELYTRVLDALRAESEGEPASDAGTH
jgi:hypothetical protein